MAQSNQISDQQFEQDIASFKAITTQEERLRVDRNYFFLRQKSGLGARDALREAMRQHVERQHVESAIAAHQASQGAQEEYADILLGDEIYKTLQEG